MSVNDLSKIPISEITAERMLDPVFAALVSVPNTDGTETIGYEVWAFAGATDARGNEYRTLVLKASEFSFADALSEYKRLENNERRPKLYKIITQIVDMTAEVNGALEAHCKKFANKD